MSWIAGCVVIESKEKKEIEKAKKYINDVVRQNADLREFPNSGARFPIYFKGDIKNPAETIDEAEEKANCYDWRRSYNIAVPLLNNSKKMESILERIKKEEEKKEEYEKKHSVRTFKANLVSCQKCGSKLNKDYLKNDMCPVCRADLRSETTKDTIKRYDKKICTLTKEYAECKKTAKCKYVVFFEEYLG